MHKEKAIITIISFFITQFLLAGVLVTCMYINDPLQLWHKAYKAKNRNFISSTIRESAKAFVRDYDFDGIIIGSSLTENTSAQKASDILGGKFFNFSISASSLYEKNIFLKYILKHKQIKQVIYVPDAHIYSKFETDADAYDFLYNDKFIDDFKIYFNNKYFLCAIGLMKTKKCLKKLEDIDKPYKWEHKKIHYERYGGFDVWIEHKDNGQIKDNFEELLKESKDINNEEPSNEYKQELENYIEKYLLEVIKENPETKFYIIVSPVSDIKLALMQRDEKLSYKKYILVLNFLVEAAQKYKNMEIYAFDDIDKLSQIKDYKDFIHYKSWINNYIISAISQKRHLITKDNIKKYLIRTDKKAKAVDYNYYYEKIYEVMKN